MTQVIKTVALIPARSLPRPVSLHARKGLAFEAGFARALRAAAPPATCVKTNLWFEYRRAHARHSAFCVPDIIILNPTQGFALVVECKLTWTPAAAAKLRDLYCPVVSHCFNCVAQPLVVVKNLLPGCPEPGLTLRAAALCGLFQWDMRSRVVW
jgi:hypothetical protein